MSLKAIFLLFLLVTTLTLTHTKPIPAKIYLDQAVEDPNVKIVIIEFDIDAVPGPEEAKKSSEECWWGPGLCYGSQWGKNSTIQLQTRALSSTKPSARCMALATYFNSCIQERVRVAKGLGAGQDSSSQQQQP